MRVALCLFLELDVEEVEWESDGEYTVVIVEDAMLCLIAWVFDDVRDLVG